MADNFKLVQAKDTVYTLNGYGAVTGLQRFNYGYSAQETNHDEIGNPVHAATSREPQTTVSFEVTDTGSLAALLARMRYDYSTQEYSAGISTDISTNAFNFDHTDLQYLIFTCGEYKAPGGTFSEAKIFPYHFVNSISIGLNADGVGRVTFDAQGSLFKPLYKPYHTTRAYSAQYASSTTVTVNSGWSVASGTHNVLALEVNNKLLDSTEVAWSAANTLTISGGSTVDSDDRVMAWLFERTPGSIPTLDYVNSIRFVKADRINIWLLPEGTSRTDNNRTLRAQSLDLTVNVPRDELKEIAKNDEGTSTFYYAPRYPLDITGQIRIFETTLHDWAQLQGKTLNESATTSTVDTDNVLDVTNWQDAMIVVEWYKVGSDSPIQRLVCSGVNITGYDGTQEINSRKEATWNLSTSEFYVEGFDV